MKKVHWSDGAKEMDFEEFKEFHKALFSEDDMKQAYRDATGKEPNAKKKKADKIENGAE
jgi:hypothetical protein